jgi:hypothetical protein
MDTAIALLAGLLIEAGPDDTLAPHRWEARPILVFAREGDPVLMQQRDAFARNRDALADRRNIVVLDTNENSALRERFRPDGFTVILAGLDGGEKAREQGLVSGGVFDDDIDAMPMRRRELNSGG